MARFKVRRKDEHLLVKVRLSYDDAVNDAELDSFAHIYIRGFLKPQRVKKNVIEYTGPMGISLSERLKRPVSKYEFFFIMEQIVDTFQKLKRYNLLPGRVMWDIHNVYYNEATKELQFLYIPFTSSRQGGTVMALLEAVGYAAVPQAEQDTDYISRFMYFLSSQPAFHAETIENYIRQEDRKVVDTVKRHTVGQSGFMTDKQKDYYKHYEDQTAQTMGGDLAGQAQNRAAAGMADEEATGLIDEEETGLLYEETALLDEEEGTALLDEEEGTALLDEYAADIHYPSLTRTLTDETVSVNKPVFRIGKEKSYVDYFVANNNAVSRSHADIITRGQRYFVMDLNSKNRTFINGQAIPVQQEVELFDGVHLKLANEEFVFHV